jgi:hypothetical protein
MLKQAALPTGTTVLEVLMSYTRLVTPRFKKIFMQATVNLLQMAFTFQLNLQAPSILYVGQAFRYSPENAFYLFNQQINFII